ncbi:hypothetical protein ACFXDE_25065, partial [Kitasatospora sp. NPDC059408]
MDVTSSARAALSHHALSGTSRQHRAELVAELVPAWEAQQESALRERRGGDRRREAGAGPKHRPVFVDRVPATLAHLRHDLPHSALAALLGVDRSIPDLAGYPRLQPGRDASLARSREAAENAALS